MSIGNWVRRLGRRSKWHLVESVVAADAVTRCGRRLDRYNFSGELQVSEVMPLTRMIGQPQLCRLCDRESLPDVPIVQRHDLSASDDPARDFDGPDPFGVEDDGLTQNETVP